MGFWSVSEPFRRGTILSRVVLGLLDTIRRLGKESEMSPSNQSFRKSIMAIFQYKRTGRIV